MIYVNEYNSPVGRMIIADDGEKLVGVWFDGQKYFMAGVSGETVKKETPVSLYTKKWLDDYFSGKEREYSLPLETKNVSAFRKTVLNALKKIPFGKTATYGEIAKSIEKERGKRVSARAVGGAVGHNPFSIIIPCHRVLGANGKITGYAGGVDKKVALLNHEGVSEGERYRFY